MPCSVFTIVFVKVLCYSAGWQLTCMTACIRLSCERLESNCIRSELKAEDI